MTKNKIIGITIVAVIVLSLVIVVWAGAGRAFIPGNRIAVISLTGPIQESGGGGLLFPAAAITPGLVRGLLEQAERDGSIKAVMLRIESPGGSIAASQEIGDMIRDFEKPIVVSMGDQATSGGYYISAHADMIIAQPGTITGSIGVIFMHLNVDGLLQKLGIERETIIGGEHKDMFVTPLTAERRDLIQRITDEAHDQFITTVAEGRGLTIAEVRELATGELFIGTQALELGLVDRLGGRQVAINAAAELAEIEVPPATIELSPPAPSPFDLFFGGGGILRDLAISRLLGDEIALLRTLLETYSLPRW
ncbi:MAG: putative signal peptide peptidase SppA [Dehalococcoidia bacterium]|nr:putative signal peptide peptidase SppA [Chloroflexota bacterium]